MPLHPQAAKFLETWSSLKQPPLESLPVDVARRTAGLGAGLLRSCPEMAAVQDVEIDGPGGPLRLRITTPRGKGPFGACLYFHGGGWVINSVDTHDDLARRLTDASGCVFVSVDYRLAPEHPYPAAIEDAFAALQWVARRGPEFQIDPNRLATAGDSAGGNLAAALCLMTRDRQGPPLRYQVLAYPITDCDLQRPSYIENADGYFLTAAQMKWFWDLYCPDLPRREEAYISPLRASSLFGLPPALILTAEYDPLRDEGEAYADALHTAGVSAALHRYPGMIHAFLRRAESFDASAEAIKEIGDSLRQAIGSPA